MYCFYRIVYLIKSIAELEQIGIEGINFLLYPMIFANGKNRYF
jgi:hypothetical protein